jgi:hypothetical protein
MTDPAAPTEPAPSEPGPSEPAPSEPPPPRSPTTNATGGWRPPRDRDRGGHVASTFTGLILILVGTWYFLDQTLGIRLPRVAWGELWPVILIGLGVLVILRASGRRA